MLHAMHQIFQEVNWVMWQCKKYSDICLWRQAPTSLEVKMLYMALQLSSFVTIFLTPPIITGKISRVTHGFSLFLLFWKWNAMGGTTENWNTMSLLWRNKEEEVICPSLLAFRGSEVDRPKYKKVWIDFKVFIEEIDLNILLYRH